MKCIYCSDHCIRKGFVKKNQRFFCKSCKHYQQDVYQYKRCTTDHERIIAQLTTEGMSISGVARITGISKSNVIKRIKKIAHELKTAVFKEENQEYEVDELYTFIGNKEKPTYIIYALNRQTRKVIDFVVGGRTTENISKIINQLKCLKPKCIYTDGLNSYPGLLKGITHIKSKHKINHIERMNLNLRTHLKRLSRKTICFSKSKEMLESCLRLYFLKYQ